MRGQYHHACCAMASAVACIAAASSAVADANTSAAPQAIIKKSNKGKKSVRKTETIERDNYILDRCDYWQRRGEKGKDLLDKIRADVLSKFHHTLTNKTIKTYIYTKIKTTTAK